MARKRKISLEVVPVCLILLSLLVGQGKATTPKETLPLIDELDSLDREARTAELDSLDREPRAAESSSTGENICIFQEPVVRSVPEIFKTTVLKAFVAPCGYLPDGIPLNDARTQCRFNRQVVVTRKREVFKRTYKVVSKCCEGWTGPNCTQRICDPACKNGGVCVNKQCFCPTGYTGKVCGEAVCNPTCRNGGNCTKPNTCSCSDGWNGISCDSAICAQECQNGGLCVAPNKCSCLPGFTGEKCQSAICERVCQMGGLCVAPNTCLCPTGYSGKNCELSLISHPENDLSFNFKRDSIVSTSAGFHIVAIEFHIADFPLTRDLSAYVTFKWSIQNWMTKT